MKLSNQAIAANTRKSPTSPVAQILPDESSLHGPNNYKDTKP